jgi:hypothetical protein
MRPIHLNEHQCLIYLVSNQKRLEGQKVKGGQPLEADTSARLYTLSLLSRREPN